MIGRLVCRCALPSSISLEKNTIELSSRVPLLSVTPFIRADAVIDAETEAKAIDARLAEVEALAKRRGHAVAAASAFPISIERIADFARNAADRGIEIVPLTALIPSDRT